MEHVSAIGVDLVRGQKTLSLIKEHGIPEGKTLFAGVVDGRNIWANDLAASLTTLEELTSILGKGKMFLLFVNVLIPVLLLKLRVKTIIPKMPFI